MIAVTYAGWRPHGLLAYLLGPGRHEDHHRPRIVAGFEPPAVLTPPKTGPGEFDFELGALAQRFERPIVAAGMPLAPPPAGTVGGPRAGAVWHTAVRLHRDDPVLTDTQWAAIAQRIMDRVGIGPAGCPWIAVRHGDDHIHLMAALVHEPQPGETRRFHPRWSRLVLRALPPPTPPATTGQPHTRRAPTALPPRPAHRPPAARTRPPGTPEPGPRRHSR